MEKYKSICNKVSNIINKEPICNKKFLKSKISSYSDEITNFHKKPKVGSNYPCLAVLLIDFVLKRDENYYPQVFLKNVNTLKKKKKRITNDLKYYWWYITDDFKFSSDG